MKRNKPRTCCRNVSVLLKPINKLKQEADEIMKYYQAIRKSTRNEDKKSTYVSSKSILAILIVIRVLTHISDGRHKKLYSTLSHNIISSKHSIYESTINSQLNITLSAPIELY